MENKLIEESAAKGRRIHELYHGKFKRVGDPFVSVDDEVDIIVKHKKSHEFFFEMLSNYDEKYKTPKEFLNKDFNKVHEHIKKNFYFLNDIFGSWKKKTNFFKKEIDGHSYHRAQDYAFIKKYSNLKTKINHLDLGPGIGSHSFYSSYFFKSNYFALEAQPMMYNLQDLIFKLNTAHYKSKYDKNFKYLNAIEMENFGNSYSDISNFIKISKTNLNLIPSWMFNCIPANSIDLVTATWMLNEINTAGVLWLISNASRCMKKNSYFYINDNNSDKHIHKPLRHMINYDLLLLKIGFKEVKRFRMNNRVNYRGSPRIFKKISNKSFTYEQLIRQELNKLSIKQHGELYDPQNI